MNPLHRLLWCRVKVAWLVVLLGVPLAACRPPVASVNLVNVTPLRVEVSVELVGAPGHVTNVVLEPNARYLLLTYDERSDALPGLTALLKGVTFVAPGCTVVRRGHAIRDLASRDPERAGWLITFRVGAACSMGSEQSERR